MQSSCTWKALYLPLSLILLVVDGRENGIFDIYKQCIRQPQITLGCPTHHLVVVRVATYYKSKESGCNTQAEDRCAIKEDALAIFWKCYESKVCNIALEDPAPVPQECSDYQGDTYIELKYKCEPRLTGPRGKLAIMSSNFTFTGSVVYLRNKGFPSPSSESEASCDITAANETYIEFIAFQFEDTLQPHIPMTQCPQTLQFWTDYAGGTERTLCSHEEDKNRPLDIPVNSQAIVNLRASRSFMMILIVQVYHEDDLTITCVDKSTAAPSEQTTVPTTKASTSTTTKSTTTTTTRADLVDPNNTPTTSKSTSTFATTTNEAVAPRSEESKSNGGEDVSAAIVVSVTVILVVIIILLIIGVLYLRYARKRDQRASTQEQTARFAFENITYDTKNEGAENGVTNIPKGTTMVVNKGISSGQNGHIPYSAPLDGARGGDRQHGAIFNNASSVYENGDKVHIYDHHENRPIAWPPKPPPGGRLSFRESKTVKDQDETPYEELPDENYETLPSDCTDRDDNTNNSNSNVIMPQKNTVNNIQAPVTVERPPPSINNRQSLNASFPTINPRLSVSLHSGIDGEMTNITHSKS